MPATGEWFAAAERGLAILDAADSDLALLKGLGLAPETLFELVEAELGQWEQPARVDPGCAAIASHARLFLMGMVIGRELQR